MSTAAFTTLQSSGGTVPTETLRRGSAKAWMNLNGTGTIALRDSFNVSSVTDNGVGSYAPAFTSAMANGNFAPLVNQNLVLVDALPLDGANFIRTVTANLLSSGFGIGAVNPGGTAFVDAELVAFDIMGSAA